MIEYITMENSVIKDSVLLANEQFKLVEVKSEVGESEFYIEGFISTTDSDKYNDIVTDEAQDDLLSQINAVPITMDLDHDSFVDEEGEMHDRPMNKIPVAKVVEAKKELRGTYVKAKLNSSHPKYKSILKSIKDGFLHSFSIAYVPVKAVRKSINGVVHRLLDKVNLLNVGITGIPVNPNATFAIVTKSFNKRQMVEEENKKFEEQLSELKSQSEEFEKTIADLKSVIEEKDKLIEELSEKNNELKSQKDEVVEQKEEEVAEVKSLKEVVEKLSEEIAEIKSKLKEPVHKGQTEAKSENIKVEEQKYNSILEMI